MGETPFLESGKPKMYEEVSKREWNKVGRQVNIALQRAEAFEAWGFRVIWDVRDDDICLVVRGPRRGICVGAPLQLEAWK